MLELKAQLAKLTSDDPLLFSRYGFTLSRVIAQRGKPRWNVSVSPDGDLCSAAAPSC